MREKIFVSYSHKDAAWHDMLQSQVGTGIYAETFEMWSDQKIGSGAIWMREIASAIASSRIALLLVSGNFLRSEFIVNSELRSILRLNEVAHSGEEGLSIWWVPLERVAKEELQRLGLGKIQAAVGSPDRPLSELDQKERADAIRELSAKLMTKLGLISDTSPAARDQFKFEVAAALASVNTDIKEALAPGDYSIIYRAERWGAEVREVAVKALVPVPRREWLAKDFIDRAKSVRKVEHGGAIAIRDVYDRPINCVVMEFVKSPTLKEHLKQWAGGLPWTVVADVLAQLAEVAAELHGMDGQPIIGPIRPSHVHYDQGTRKARISLVHIANETLKSCEQRPTLLLDSDALTYLIPERYAGRKLDSSADQYYLGLLGLELLQGTPPIEVSVFNHLEAKRNFFESPRAFFADLPVRQPALSFVLTKMLEQEPHNRWPSIADLAITLKEVAAAIVPKVVKLRAANDYRSKLHNNSRFFESFYRTLFRSSPEICTIFVQRGVTMDEQHRKLDQAVHSLFSFEIEPTALEEHAERHRELGLKAEHFELFREAFLDSLRETQMADAYSIDAWRATLDSALAFMSDKVVLKL